MPTGDAESDEETMMPLSDLRIALLATDGVDDVQFRTFRDTLSQAGAMVEVIAPAPGQIQAYHLSEKSFTPRVDHVVGRITPNLFDALVLPGGRQSAARLRDDEDALGFIKAFDRAGKPIAAIGHAAWELAAAGLANGRSLAGHGEVADSIRIAGGNFLDREVVVDENWVTSRSSDDLPVMLSELTRVLSQVPRHEAA